MCGLAGILNVSGDLTAEQLQAEIGCMLQPIHHRGPDDTGTWCDPIHGITLGFQRLSIVDLSPAGHQPMHSASGRLTIVFNGEIYNYRELRDELISLGHTFRGHSDTETLLEGFERWGIESTIRRCVGMFAFAVWDHTQRVLTLGRDRLGKKPLYFWRSGPLLLFGSETKSFRAHPAFKPEIDREQVGEFLKWSYLPNTSIFKGVVAAIPGSLTTFRLDDDELWKDERFPEVRRYWSFRQSMTNARQLPFHGSYDQAVDRLDELLTEAVGCRMVADVPLGAFLSGGIDSSLVVALMQKQSSKPVKTFTIGFEEAGFNEAPFAKSVAQHLGTDHTELYVTSKEAQDVIPLLPKIFDEPFADSSQIPTYLVSQLARQHVTVALSGDGGDELFCGYRRYFDALGGFFPDLAASEQSRVGMVSRMASISRKMPDALRHLMVEIFQLAGRISGRRLAHKFSVAADLFSDAGPHLRYLRNLSHWQNEDALELGIPMSQTRVIVRDLCDWFDEPATKPAEYQQVWQAYDTLHYLPGDILTKVDRASMSVSLEARNPLLDHRVVEFAWSLPHEFKVDGTRGKRILRDVLAKYVPQSLFERPKVGFGVPIDSWLRGPLREWAEDLLNEDRLKREGFFQPAPIRRKWREHLDGKTDWSYLLWDVLMFEAWLQHLNQRAS